LIVGPRVSGDEMWVLTSIHANNNRISELRSLPADNREESLRIMNATTTLMLKALYDCRLFEKMPKLVPKF